ncbi:iron ABC transporter ATP-binding protein [Nocardioides sp. SYSU DS0663]|uniref:iron ABC transporter ATP-binding protein n=1 Tax=Nocardioides sp. SYSU DS0663 TaxID=3416445 RepID=UPI003F4C383A
MIEVAGVTKSYGAVRVVDDVSLRVPVGGMTSLIGPNGAGKSTLLSMVARLLPVDSGRITVDGIDVNRASSAEVARRLAILRQDNHVPLRLTVRELVAFGRHPHSRGRTGPADAEHVARALRHVSLLDLADRYLDELSGGQRQRAFVAMVLCQDTDYVLLDEPLNNLDMKQSVEVMRLLRRAVDELGKTVVLVLHDINVASAHSDRIVAMRAGRVAADGTPREVLSPDVLRDVYDLDIDVHEVGGHRFGLYWT